MNNETTQRSAKLALRILLLASLATLIVLGALPIVVKNELPGAFQSFWTVLFICIAIVAFGQSTFSRAGFTLAESGLTVGRPFGDHWISYHSITRIERVSRKGSSQGERVRLSFVDSGEEKSVEIKAANPTLLIHDVLARCPHIYKSKSQKTKRSGNFRRAKESHSQPRRRNPPVEY